MVTFQTWDFWEGSTGDTGGEGMLLWHSQRQILAVVFTSCFSNGFLLPWKSQDGLGSIGILKITSFPHSRPGCSGPHPAWPHAILSMVKRQKRGFWDLCGALAGVGSLGSLELQQWPGQAAHPPHLLEAGVGQHTRQGLGVEGGNSQWEQTPNPTPCPVIYIWFPCSYLHCFPLWK